MEIGARERAWLDQDDAWVRETVRERGWAIRYVMADGDDSPPFGYTVGLYDLDQHPELLVFGVDQHSCAHILNALGDRVKSGERFTEDGQLVTFEKWPHRVTVRHLPNPEQILFDANRYYRRPDSDPVPAVQLFWDDRWHRFPWDDGYDPPAWLQPMPGTFRA